MENIYENILKFDDFIGQKPSSNLTYHLENKISVLENIFRPGSTSFFELLRESRNFQELLSDGDRVLFEESDLGLWDRFEGEMVPLDLPMLCDEFITEAEYNGKKVSLGKPMRSSGPKKYKVYVKNPKTGRVKVVHFGDVKGGLTTKINDPAARRSFIARHRCRRKWKPSDRLSAGYWSCNLPRYKNIFSGSYSGYW
jgi:hypothetical protein